MFWKISPSILGMRPPLFYLEKPPWGVLTNGKRDLSRWSPQVLLTVPRLIGFGIAFAIHKPGLPGFSAGEKITL